MKKLLIVALLFSLKQISAQVCFNNAVYYPAVATPSSVCNADFNNDGFVDMAVNDFNGNRVYVLINTGLASMPIMVNI